MVKKYFFTAGSSKDPKILEIMQLFILNNFKFDAKKPVLPTLMVFRMVLRILSFCDFGQINVQSSSKFEFSLCGFFIFLPYGAILLNFFFFQKSFELKFF